jgi:DNA-binding response OmpR family regulator
MSTSIPTIESPEEPKAAPGGISAAPEAKRVLIGDADVEVASFVRHHLEAAGFTVEALVEASEVVARAVGPDQPDVVLIDVTLPGMEEFGVLEAIRANPKAASMAIVLLTSKVDSDHVIEGLDRGADDYIRKPFEVEELVARVKSVLRRSKLMRDVSPLTGLPGNFRATAEMERRINAGEPLAIAHLDLDNFKAFNDHYGFLRGDQVIKFAAHVMIEAAAGCSDTTFAGHIGGDDYIALLHPDEVDRFSQRVMAEFDAGILDFYDPADSLRGFIDVPDRNGENRAFPIVSISIGVATNRTRVLGSRWEASSLAAEMKEVAKGELGSAYAVDRRVG